MDNYVKALKWLVGSVGISGILITMGFIIEISFQERLGYSPIKLDIISTYLTTSGQFFSDTILSVISLYTDIYNWILTIIAIFLIIVLICIWRKYIRKYNLFKRRVILNSVLLVLVFFILSSIAIFDLPSTGIKNMLVRGLTMGKFLESQNPISSITKWLWLQQICYRVGPEPLRSELKKNHIICDYDTLEHKNNIRHYFLSNIILSFLLLFFAFSLMRKYRDLDQQNKIIDSILITLIILKLILIPYTYSKNIRSTSFNEVIIKNIYKEDNISKKRGLILKDDKTEIKLLVKIKNKEETLIIPKKNIKLKKIISTDPKSNGVFAELTIINEEDKLVPIHGFILSKTEDEVVLFNKDQNLYIIPSSAVFLTMVERENDVLQFIFKKQLSNKSVAPEAP